MSSSLTTYSSIALSLVAIPVGGYLVWKYVAPASTSTGTALSSAKSKGKAKGKKGKGKKVAATPTTAPTPAAPAAPPPTKEKSSFPTSAEVVEKKLPALQKKGAAAGNASPPKSPAVAVVEDDDDGTWSQVLKNGSLRPESAPLLSKRALKAAKKLERKDEEKKEKLTQAEVYHEGLKQKVGKTGVEDMLPAEPLIARVMKISPSTPAPQPAVHSPVLPPPVSPPTEAESSGGNDDVDSFEWEKIPQSTLEPEDEWTTVPIKSKPLQNKSTSVGGPTLAQQQHAAKLVKAKEIEVKKAKANAKKNEEKKAAKAVLEEERLKKMGEQRKGAERARVQEFLKNQQKQSSKISGGMSATINPANGKLVWE